jgi:hypothetical protein
MTAAAWMPSGCNSSIDGLRLCSEGLLGDAGVVGLGH